MLHTDQNHVKYDFETAAILYFIFECKTVKLEPGKDNYCKSDLAPQMYARDYPKLPPDYIYHVIKTVY